MNNINTILFDLDGTIVDSLGMAIKTFNKMARMYGFKKIKHSEINRFRNMHLLEVAKEHGLFKYGPLAPLIIWDFKRRESREIEFCHPFPGMQKVIVDLKKSGYTLGILTSNSKKNAEAFLKSHNLLEYFDFVNSEFSGFGKHKKIKKIMEKRNLTKNTLVYIGDEVRDIEAAHKLPIPIVSVSWGYNSIELISKHDPEFIAEKPEQISDLIQIISN